MTADDGHQRSMRRKFEKVTETTEVDNNNLVESVNKVTISSDERTCDKSLKKFDDYVGGVEKELKDLCIKPALSEKRMKMLSVRLTKMVTSRGRESYGTLWQAFYHLFQTLLASLTLPVKKKQSWLRWRRGQREKHQALR